MGDYDEYTLAITFTSSLGSKLQSDTIFGHICWAWRYIKSENDLRIFLNTYDEASIPPLLVSNGFPLDYLPKPILPPVTQEEIQATVKDDRIEASHKIATIKKLDIIPNVILEGFIRNPITPPALFLAIYDKYKPVMKAMEGRQIVMVQHNTIDRIKGSVREGGLYAQEDTFFEPGSDSFQMYLRTNYFSEKDLNSIFKYISIEGFGRDGSTGKGHFDFTLNKSINLPESENPNAFMTLSSYIPTADDPVKGFYQIVHKYGKLGGHYAKGVAEVQNNPFKVPLIMFSAGSTFFDREYRKYKTYGRLLDRMHHNKHIRHYAYAFPMGIHIEGEYENI